MTLGDADSDGDGINDAADDDDDNDGLLDNGEYYTTNTTLIYCYSGLIGE